MEDSQSSCSCSAKIRVENLMFGRQPLGCSVISPLRSRRIVKDLAFSI
jgi:hypothetical protein